MNNQLISEIVKLFPEDFELEKITQYKFSNQKNQLQKIYQLRSISRISINNFPLFQEIEQKLRQFNLPNTIYTQLIDSIFPKYRGNEQVYGFSNLHLYQDGVFSKIQKFDTLLDFVNIIIFWTSDNYDSLQTFKDVHTKLNGDSLDIRIFGINIDSTYESWEKCMLELQTYESYHLSKNNKNYELLMKALHITTLPFFFILDKNQTIDLIGTYDITELDYLIQQLCKVINTQYISGIKQEKVRSDYNSVSLDDFKNIKNLMKQDIQEMISAIFSEEDKINLQLFKRTKFTRKNQKEVYYRSFLFIENQISDNSQESYEAFQQYLGEVIPQKQFLNFKTTKIVKISEEQQNIRNFVQEILQQFNLESILYQQESLNYKWDYEKNSFICEHIIQDQFKLNKIIDLKQFDKIYKQIQKAVSDLDQQFQDKVSIHFNQLLQPIELGHNFQNIDGFYNKLGQETIIEHKPGQMLVIVWLVPCPFIIIKLEQNRQKLKEKYGDKLNIVYLLIEKGDDDIEIIYQNQPEANFFYPMIDPQIIRQKYNVKYFPFMTIVDQFGIVRHADIFQNFNKYIRDIQVMNLFTANRIDCDWENLNDYLQYQELITKSLGNSNKFQYNITIKQNQNQEFIVINDYMTRQINLKYCHQMVLNLDYYVERQKNTIIQNLIKSYNIPYPAAYCDLCNQLIGKENPYYFNHFKIQIICCECAEEKKHGEYIIKDVLAFINAPISDIKKLFDIDRFRFGKNLQPVGPGNKVHKANCDNCAKTIIGDRYILINGDQGKMIISGFQDYCYKCFNLIKNRNYKGDQNFKNINENSIFLRVVYSFGYRFY